MNDEVEQPKTPRRHLSSNDEDFELPATPTSLGSACNKDLIYPMMSSPKAVYDESRDHIPGSIESFLSDRRDQLQNFQDITGIHALNNHAHESESDLIQKWLQDRKRWDTIQHSYEQKVADAQTKLEHKTTHFNRKLDAMHKRELELQSQIRRLTQQIDIAAAKSKSKSDSNAKANVSNEQYLKLERDHDALTENNRALKAKLNDVERSVHELREELNAKEHSVSKLKKETQRSRAELTRAEQNNAIC